MLNDRSRHRRLAALVGILTSLVLVISPAGPAAAAPNPGNPTPNATFGIGPARADGRLDGRSNLNYDISPGGRLLDHLAVHNYGDRTLVLAVYAADATSAADGAIGYRARSNPGSDAGRWITFANNATVVNLTLGPKQTAVLPVNVVVPHKASPGDHVAGVFAALTSKIEGNGSVGSNQNFEQRVALRAYFRISGTIRPELSIEHLTMTYHQNWNPIGKGSATVSYAVHNTGNVILGGAQHLSISGLLGGGGQVPPLAQIPLLLPGGTAHVAVQVKHVTPAVLVHARVTITPVATPSAVNPGTHAAMATATTWAVPWLLLLIILLIIGSIVYSIIRSRGPRRRYHGERRLDRTPVLAGKP